MGGKKKLSLKQIERRQSTGGKKSDKEKEKKAGLGEKEKSGVIPPNLDDESVLSGVKKIRVLTPYNVASHFNVRVSVARDLLKRLEERGFVQMIGGNHSLRIYKPTK